jgi:L-threonylcarbamoyladenylate synthase
MTASIQTQIYRINPQEPQYELIQLGASVLHQSGLVAFPTETVYGLGANALDEIAVGRIFSAKDRPVSDPVIVHLYSLDQLFQVAVDVSEIVYRLADRFWPGPLTLVLRRHSSVPAMVSSGRDTVAVRIPNHPVPLALLRAAQLPVAAPSANRFSRPSATTADHVREDLDGQVDLILDGGAAPIGVESTILDLTKVNPVVLRPGGIPLEQLREMIPSVQVVERHLRPEDDGIEAPGMLLKHYSPRAKLLLFTGHESPVRLAMQDAATELIKVGKSVGALVLDNERAWFFDTAVHHLGLGMDAESVSHHLFDSMRALDRLGVDVILVHDFGRDGLGAALWDRLLRAAEGHVISC